jgi:hypothetical protein
MEGIMYQRVSFSDFLDAFRAHGREGQFSHKALKALFNHLEEVEEDTGTPIELDVIALCCEYQEASADEIIAEYGLDTSECESAEDRYTLAEEFLEQNTTVVWTDGDKVFLFQSF